MWKSSKQVWAQLHEDAFRYFGGSSEYVVLDNLREGVITPDLYEPEINRLYAAMLEHYGVVADPARVRDPNRKGTVESAIKHTQSTALKGRRFESIEAQNEFLMHWEENWAARRIHGSARRQVRAMFQEEKPHLQALPSPGSATSRRSYAPSTTTPPSADRSNYAARPAPSAPSCACASTTPPWRSAIAAPRSCCARIRATPSPARSSFPRASARSTRRQTSVALASAGDIGPRAKSLCQHLFDVEGRVGHRGMWGIVALAKKYPAWLVEQACDHALRHHLYRYRQVRAWIARHSSPCRSPKSMP